MSDLMGNTHCFFQHAKDHFMYSNKTERADFLSLSTRLFFGFIWTNHDVGRVVNVILDGTLIVTFVYHDDSRVMRKPTIWVLTSCTSTGNG